MQYRLKQRHQIRYLVAFTKESLPSSHVHYIKAGSVDHAQSLCDTSRHFKKPVFPSFSPKLTTNSDTLTYH